MAGSTYSTNLKIELMATGENSGTWGDITNTNMGTALEQAIVGYGNPDYVSDANLTISISNSNAAQAARALVLNVTSVFGALTATRELVVPTIQKQYIVQNNTTGGQSITVKTSGGTGITVPNGRKAHLYVDGTNVIQMFDFVDINGGAIDGTPIGAASASTGAFTTLNASGATTLDGSVALGNASGDLITFPGTITSNLLFTDNTYDIGASGATRPRNLFLAGAATIGGNLSVGGTLTLTGGVNLNGNVTVGDNSSDTLTINSTITSNLIFTDNTYDIGASGATRPRNLFLAGNATIGGAQTLAGALTVDSTTDSSSTTTGSIQTDGGLGVAKALFVGTTANIAGAVTLGGGTANGVAYLNGSKVLTTGSALTFDGTNLATTGSVLLNNAQYYNSKTSGGANIRMLGINSGNTAYIGPIDSGPGDTILNASSSSANIQFYASGAEQMRLTSTGLGIGTSSPSVKLDVIGGTSYDGNFFLTSQFRNVAGAAEKGILLGYNNADTSSILAPGFANGVGALAFWTQNGTNWAERMRLSAAGNLGLGVGPEIGLTHFDVSSGASLYGISTGAQVAGNAYNNGSWRYRASGPNRAARLDVNAGDTGGFQFFTSSSTGTAGNLISFTQSVTIDGAGQLGVGTTSPGARFDVNGSARVYGGNGFFVQGEVTGGSPFLTGGALEFGATSTAAVIQAFNRNSFPAYDLSLSTTSNIRFFTASSERARIDSSGNFLIGASSGSYRLVVRPPATFGNAEDGNIAISTSLSGGSVSNPTTVGGIVFGDQNATNSYQGRLAVIQDNPGASTASHMRFYTNSGGGNVSCTERARITSSGTLLINFTGNPGNTKAYILGDSGLGQDGMYVESRSTGSGGTAIVGKISNTAAFLCYWLYGSSNVGSITSNGTSTFYNTSSDYRLKTVTGAVTGHGERIDALNPVDFTWNVDGSRARGFLAHQFQEVYPSSVTGAKDAVDKDGKPRYQGMQAGSPEVIADLVAEIKSLRARVAALESNP